MSTKRLTFGDGARGNPGHYNAGATPANMVPALLDVAGAMLDIFHLLPADRRPRIPPIGTDAGTAKVVEAIGKAAWRFLSDSQIPELWPYADNVSFNPGDRARFLRALAILDLWTFRSAK